LITEFSKQGKYNDNPNPNFLGTLHISKEKEQEKTKPIKIDTETNRENITMRNTQIINRDIAQPILKQKEIRITRKGKVIKIRI